MRLTLPSAIKPSADAKAAAAARRAAQRAYKEDLKRREAEVREAKAALKPYDDDLKKRKRAKSFIPRTVADTIPFIADYDDGLFEARPGFYSKSYLLTDINYQISNDDEQERAFIAYGELLNYFSDDVAVQVTIDNRVISLSEMESRIYCKLTGDDHDGHREEYNRILRRQIVAGRNDIRQSKYITVTMQARSPIEALIRFAKMDGEIIANIKRIGASARVMATEERLEILHDKFNPGHEGEFHIDYGHVKRQGLSSKDYIAPTSFFFGRSKDFMIGDSHYRVMALSNLPASLSDELLRDCGSFDFPLIITKTIQPMSPEKAHRLVMRQLTGMESNKIEAERKALQAGYSPETINHDLKHSLDQAKELLDDLLNKNQKMFFVTITMMAYGHDLAELEENCKSLDGAVRKYACQLKTLNYQQEDGFRITLPLGNIPDDLRMERTLTTESAAIFMPFNIQELFQRGGYYYGLNQLSRNLILCDRTRLKTPSGFMLGTAGSGKSFAVKREMLNVLLSDARTSILVIDPENEYGGFARAFGGEVIKISADSANYINPLDMPEDYGLDEDDPDDLPLEAKKSKALRKKSDFIMSIIEKMIAPGSRGEGGISPAQKTIIDRCVINCYREYLDGGFADAHLPTLLDLQDEFDREAEESDEAAGIAEAAEYYTRGSMDIFSHRTNVDSGNRLVVFNVRDCGDQIKPIAQTIMFDYIWSRMVRNKALGVRTYCYCDEIHVMFASHHSAYFLKQLYKRGRKYGLAITGVTQNVEELLRSEVARGMIGNSDFLLMLNQSPEDLKLLVHMLGISPAQVKHLQNAEPGSGLLKAEEMIVPFMDKFPDDSYLYKLMSTRFGEQLGGDESGQ